MKNLIALQGLVILLLLTGCDAFQQKPVRDMRQFVNDVNAVCDILQGVRDPQSAEAVVDTLDQKYAALCTTAKGLPEMIRQNKETKVLKTTLDQLMRDFENAMQRFGAEQKRLRNVRGLPTQFWKIVTVRNNDMAGSFYDFAKSLGQPVPAEDAAWVDNIHNLLEHHGFEKTLRVELVNLPPRLEPAAFDRLKQLAPDATLYHVRDEEAKLVALAPVPDFKAVTSKLDMGTVVFADEGSRTIRIEVDGVKLMPQGNSRRQVGRMPLNQRDPAQAQFDQKTEEERLKAQEESRARAEAARKRMEEARIAREKEERGPDPSDPQYYEKLVDRMLSTNPWHRDKAIAALLAAEPSQVPDDARKKIARGFKTLAEGDNVFERKKAVKGLVIYGGTYSVPILLKMLATDHPFDEEEILKGLAELKDPRAAKVFAERLGKFRYHEMAVAALHDMGSGAEDAVIEVAPAQDAKICVAALTLLGDIGTANSLSILQKGLKSRNPNVRQVAQDSIRKINIRTRQAKMKAKPADE